MIEDRYHIAILVSDINSGGTEETERLILKGLDRRLFYVTLISPGQGGSAERLKHYADDNYTIGTGSFPKLSINTAATKYLKIIACIKLATWFIKSSIGLRSYLIKKRIEILHTHGVHCNLLGTLVAAMTGQKVIAHVHAPSCRLGHGSGIEGFLASKCVTAFVANSKFTQSTFPKCWGKKSTTILNSTEINSMKNSKAGDLRNRLNLSRCDVLIGSVGTLSHRKGSDRFIEVISGIKKQIKHVKGVIIGESISEQYSSELRHMIKNKGLQNNVQLLGPVRQASRFMGDFDVFLMCSRPVTETFGMVVVEAMSAGVPVVAFNNDAMPEIIENGATGFLVEEGNIEKMCQKVVEILTNKDLADKLANNSRVHVENRFDEKIMVNSVQKLYLNHILR